MQIRISSLEIRSVMFAARSDSGSMAGESDFGGMTRSGNAVSVPWWFWAS